MPKPEFPPRSIDDVLLYTDEAVVAGYRSHKITDDPPGPNHDPGYRWGWTNARKEATRREDGFERLRSEYIQFTRVKQ